MQLKNQVHHPFKASMHFTRHWGPCRLLHHKYHTHHTVARDKEFFSFAGCTEIRIGLWSSHAALACTARPFGVSGTDRDSPRNLYCKYSDCFDRLAPNRDKFFWWSAGLTVIRHITDHLCFNITEKGHMIAPEWYNRILDYTRKYFKTFFSQWK